MAKRQRTKHVHKEKSDRDDARIYRDRKPRLVQLKRIEWSVAVFTTAVAVALHVHFLSHASALWRDEINSVNLASMPSLQQVWHLTEFESFPVFWTLMLRACITVGIASTDAGLRVFGFLGGLAILSAVWLALVNLTKEVPLASLALIAVNPEIVRWGDSVRAWGLGACLGVVTFVFLQKAVKVPTKLNIGCAGLAAILAVQCMYQNSVLLAAIAVAIILPSLFRRQWRLVAIPIGVGAIAALTVLPYISIISRVSQWNILSRSNFTFNDFIAKVLEVVEASGYLVKFGWFILMAVAVLIAIQTAASVRRKSSADGDVAISSGVLIVATLTGLAAFYVLLGYPTQSWYYIGLMVLVALAAEVAAATALSTPTARLVRVVFALGILAAGVVPAWESLRAPQTNMDVVASHLNAEAQDGDVVIINPWYFALTFDRYYRGAAQVTTIPPLEDRKLHRYDLIKHAMLAADSTPVLQSQMQHALESRHKVFLVGAYEIPPAGTILQSLPPPPLPGTGWHAEPYLELWSLEVGTFLRDHALGGRTISIDTPGGRFETANVAVVQGWRP